MNPNGINHRALAGVIALIVSAGALHHWVHRLRAHESTVSRPLYAPLSDLPERIGRFVRSRDIPLSAEVLQIARVDQSLYREYLDADGGAPIQVYVGYWGQQNLGMGHGPEVCYPAVGWKPDTPATEETLRIPDANGGSFPATIAVHHFARAESLGVERRAVAFTAVVDGEFRSSSNGTFFHKPPDSRRCGFLAHVHVATSVADGKWQSADDRIVEFMGRLLPHLSVCLFGDQPDDVAVQGTRETGESRTDGSA